MMIALETGQLAIGYPGRRGENRLAQGLDLELSSGRLVGLLGANGIGKSTLLRTLAGIQPALAGQVLVSGVDIRSLQPVERARRLGLVLTTPSPPSLMNGYSLVALGRHPHTDWLGSLREEDHRQIRAALRAVKAQEIAGMPVAQLSDGQRQKLFIARALAQECPVMLLDEPTAYLDLPRRIETMALLKRLAHEQKRAILVSTHDLELALRSCDRLWLMSASGITVGAPEDLALDGSLGDALAVDGISFDQHRGSFFADARGGLAVRVHGAGIEAIWLRRALKRAGYTVSERTKAIVASPGQNGRGPAWQLQVNERVSHHATIAELLSELECSA